MHIVNCGVIFTNKKNLSGNLFFLMSKSHITPGKLIATGSIVPELHYGAYLRDWWIFSKEKTQDYPIPLRLGLEVMIQLNNSHLLFT